MYFNYKFNKQKQEVEKLNLELRLLTSQMNPHFMFNTINSIQLYILEKSKQEAIQYLTDFAKLLRQSLDFSFNNYISLKDEVTFLERYIGLENKRFNEHFKLEVKYSDNININKDKIPSFLLQPIIENVIQHANYKEGKEKIISLNFLNELDYIQITIIDFGHFKENKTNKIIKHKSYGLDIIKNRLKIYNSSRHNENDVLIETNNKSTGYTVILKIYLHEYNYS